MNNSEDILFDLDTILLNLSDNDIRNILIKADYYTVMICLSICNDAAKVKIISNIAKHLIGDLLINSDRIRSRVSIEDKEKVAKKINEIRDELIDTNTNINRNECYLGPNTDNGYQRYDIIPNKESLSHEDFLLAYYDTLWLLYACSDMVFNCGLLEADRVIYTLSENDFFRRGLRLLADGEESEVIQRKLSTLIEGENDKYKRTLMQIQLRGIINICEAKAKKAEDIITDINSYYGIDDAYISRACEAYTKGDISVFSYLFRKGSEIDKIVNPDEHLKAIGGRGKEITHKFSELEERMSSESRERIDKAVQEALKSL